MAKQKVSRLKFDVLLAMMKSRNAWQAEEGFHLLLPRANEFIDELLSAFDQEQDIGMRCWLLELIGEARSEKALDVLCITAISEDEVMVSSGVRGLKMLDTHAARTFMFQNKISYDKN